MKISGALLPSFYELGLIVPDQLRTISRIDIPFQFPYVRSKCNKFIFSFVFEIDDIFKAYIYGRLGQTFFNMDFAALRPQVCTIAGWGIDFSTMGNRICA